MVPGSLAEEFKQAALIQTMRLDCQVDEERLKRRACRRFSCSGSEECGAHASLNEWYNASQFLSCYCFKLGLGLATVNEPLGLLW